MLSDELVKKLADYPAFQEFALYMIGKVEKLDSIDGLEEMTNEQAGEEAKARAKAKTTLYEILSPFIQLTDKKEPSKEQIEEAQEKYGL